MTILLNETVVSNKDRYYIRAERISAGREFLLDNYEGTYFILALNATLKSDIGSYGTFGAILQGKKYSSINGDAVIISMPGLQRSMQTLSIVDPTVVGDLSYIDGCSNSILIGPPRNGDPCLNYLYFPEGIGQTFHTHPSLRIGMIINGEGAADFYEQGELKTVPLRKGDWFVLPRHVKHRFQTSNSSLSIIVFHPDSDDGPIDEHNPMKTRTYLK